MILAYEVIWRACPSKPYVLQSSFATPQPFFASCGWRSSYPRLSHFVRIHFVHCLILTSRLNLSLFVPSVFYFIRVYFIPSFFITSFFYIYFILCCCNICELSTIYFVRCPLSARNSVVCIISNTHPFNNFQLFLLHYFFLYLLYKCLSLCLLFMVFSLCYFLSIVLCVILVLLFSRCWSCNIL